MTTDGTVAKSRVFRGHQAFDYLEDDDRYVSRRPDPKWRFAIIGCGMMGTEHIRNTALEGQGVIHGLYDPAPASLTHAQRVWQKATAGQDVPAPRIYESLEEACADPDVDAFFVCTPNYTHLEVMRVVAEHDKAIFLEKPIATSVEDAYEVCRLATQHPKLVQFGLQYRYKAIYAEAMAEALDRKTLGTLHNISLLEHRFPFLDKVSQWNKFNATTGGTLIEKCCHYFDLINLFAGSKPTSVFASGRQAVNFRDFTRNGKAADGLDHASVIINYENGTVGSFSLCMFVPGSVEELVLCGDAGRLQAREQSELGSANQNRIDIWVGENGASRSIVPAYPKYIEQAGHHGSTFYQHVDFVNALSTGRSSGAAIYSGFWSVVVGAAAQRSIEMKEAVVIDQILPDGFDGTYA